MRPPQIIVCETTGRWATHWRRAVSGDGATNTIRESRSLAQCDGLLGQFPASLVALEIEPQRLDRAVAWLARLEQRFPNARVVAMADSISEPVRRLLREAGALLVIDSPRALEPAVLLWRRHAARAQREGVSLTEQIWDRLPWPHDASAVVGPAA